MFSRISTIAFLALPLLAAASPLEIRDGQCSTGNIQCCEKTTSTTSTLGETILGLLSVVGDVGGLIGIGCSPVSVASTGSCTTATYCCANDPQNVLISLGCTEIDL